MLEKWIRFLNSRSDYILACMKILTHTLPIARAARVAALLLLLAAGIMSARAISPVAAARGAAEASLPGRWMYTPPPMVQELPPDDAWWHGFGDSMLDSLIRAAQERNYDVAIALKRIELARRGVQSARAGYFPTIDLAAGYTASRTSGAMTKHVGPAIHSNYMNVGAQASWEPDVFGRITARVREAKAGVSVSRADYAATMVSICSEVAEAYIQLRMYQAQLQLMEEHLKSQERVLNIVKARHEAGLVSGLDEAQAQTVFGSTKAQIPPLKMSVAASVNTIATLLGMYPADIADMLTPVRELPRYSAPVRTMMPAEMLRRRPDIVEAERTLAQEAAALGVSKKEFMPRLSIQGSVGYAAHDAGELFKGHSLVYSVAPTLSWTLFDGFGRRAAVESARSQMEIASAQYEQTVLAAVTDVENALNAYINATELVDELRDVVTSAGTFFSEALEQYRSGLINFTPVADAEISLLQYANSLIQARGQRMSSLINLYKAQGGGIEIE